MFPPNGGSIIYEIIILNVSRKSRIAPNAAGHCGGLWGDNAFAAI
jgi:hypothetical protein